MKKITVEVTEDQHRYVQAFAHTLGMASLGDFMLLMALAGLAYAESDEEGRLSLITHARIQFLENRRIPKLDPDDLLITGVNTRSASEFPQRREKEQKAQ